LPPHARPQALDQASYPLEPDFWKGLGTIHVGPPAPQPISALADKPVSG